MAERVKIGSVHLGGAVVSKRLGVLVSQVLPKLQLDFRRTELSKGYVIFLDFKMPHARAGMELHGVESDELQHLKLRSPVV